MTDYQTAATEAAQFLHWLDRARKGAEALQYAANIEHQIAERSAALKVQGAKLDTLREQEAELQARVAVLQETHEELLQRTREMQRQYTDAKAAVARLLEV